MFNDKSISTESANQRITRANKEIENIKPKLKIKKKENTEIKNGVTENQLTMCFQLVSRKQNKMKTNICVIKKQNFLPSKSNTKFKYNMLANRKCISAHF